MRVLSEFEKEQIGMVLLEIKSLGFYSKKAQLAFLGKIIIFLSGVEKEEK